MLAFAIFILAATATATATLDTGGKLQTACANISSSYQSWAARGGTGTFAGIPGSTAHECLRSMPFHPQLALQFLKEYEKYLQFHSTIHILKHLPLRLDTYEQSGINMRNAYSPGDDSTPLQFLYEPADCRLFFTAENYMDPATAWAAAAASMFLNGSCVDATPAARQDLSISPAKTVVESISLHSSRGGLRQKFGAERSPSGKALPLPRWAA